MLALALAAVLLAGQPNQLGAFEQRLSTDPENLKLAAEYRQLVIAANAYDRAIDFFEKLSERPNAGPYVYLNLAFACIDKIPAVGAFRRISIGNKATRAVTRSIELRPSDLAYLVRGMVNLRFEKGIFHRTPQGVADLEEARRLAGARRSAAWMAHIYVSLGDGYWRLKNRAKAREVWQEGLTRFPADSLLRLRVSATDDVIGKTIDQTLDAGARVDTSLKELTTD